MYNVRRREYKGYRIETYLRDPRGWCLFVYRLSTKLPPLGWHRDVRFPSPADAIAAGIRDIDWALNASPPQSGLAVALNQIRRERVH